jgi:ribokinase
VTVDVCVVGSANLDLVATVDRLPLPGETVLGTTFAEHPGGKGLNQAVAAARAGGAGVAFVGAVGRDGAADILRGVLADEGIDVGGLRQVTVASGRALIGVDGAAENSIIVVPGANAEVTVGDVPRCAVLLVQLEVPLRAVAAALAAGRAAGATTVLNPAPAAELDAELLTMCDVVVPNEHEAMLLGGPHRLRQLGARAVVVTHGARGVTIHTAAGALDLPAFVVEAVDTTGAGDTFCGTLAARLAAGDDLALAARYASAAAALCTTGRGAVPSIPTVAEVRALLG